MTGCNLLNLPMSLVSYQIKFSVEIECRSERYFYQLLRQGAMHHASSQE